MCRRPRDANRRSGGAGNASRETEAVVEEARRHRRIAGMGPHDLARRAGRAAVADEAVRDHVEPIGRMDANPTRIDDADDEVVAAHVTELDHRVELRVAGAGKSGAEMQVRVDGGERMEITVDVDQTVRRVVGRSRHAETGGSNDAHRDSKKRSPIHRYSPVFVEQPHICKFNSSRQLGFLHYTPRGIYLSRVCGNVWKVGETGAKRVAFGAYFGILANMVITHHGGQCFKVVFGGTTLAFDPISKKSSLSPVKFGADVAFVSMNHPDFNGVDEVTFGTKAPFVVDGPGEYEVGDVTVRGYGVKTTYDKKERFNTLYQVTLEGMNILFLGALSTTEIDPKILSELGDVDILFIPVGDGEVLGASAASKLATKFEAHVIIPMHYDKKSLDAFLKEEGSNGAPLDKLTIKKKDVLMKEGEVVVLKG